MGGVQQGGAVGGGILPGIDTVSAKVSLVNQTGETLTRVDQSDDNDDPDNGRPSTGSFKTLPPDTIAPDGGRADFEFEVDHLRGHTDAQGFVTYQIGDAQRFWKVTFTNPALGTAHGESELTPPGNGFTTPTPTHGGGPHAEIHATLHQDGHRPGPGPTPGPGPGPSGELSRCIITVTNSTQQVLTLVDEGHHRGGFIDLPKPTLKAGESDNFASAETQGVTDPAQKGETGHLTYQIGQAGHWQVSWDNPHNAQNTADGTVSGTADDTAFHSLAQIGEGDDNVPVAFTLSGGGQGPHPDPQHQADWNPPEEAPGEPTLRHGDVSKDGWVEYAQQLLNGRVHHNLAIDGIFGDATLHAVHSLQQSYDIMDDGVIGNQTWACLRDETPRPAGTDGRTPHSFEETGPQARWSREHATPGAYDALVDVLTLIAVSTGETPIDQYQATVRIVGANGQEATTEHLLGIPFDQNPGGGANYHVYIGQVAATFGHGSQTCEAYLPAELGGDYMTFEFHV